MLWLVIKRGLGFAILLGLIGLAALWAGVSQTRLSDAFEEAETVTGTVTRLEKLVRPQSGSTSTTLRVTVTVPGGRHREQVSAAFFETLQEGQRVPVLRLDGTPPRYRVEPARLAASARWAIGMSVFFVASALALGWFGWWSGRNEWRLRTHGVPAQGTITALPDGIVPKLTFSYTDRAGATHEATVPRPAGGFTPGQKVEIRFDPERPGMARLAPPPAG